MCSGQKAKGLNHSGHRGSQEKTLAILYLSISLTFYIGRMLGPGKSEEFCRMTVRSPIAVSKMVAKFL
jgi:hypothetical protein